MAVQLEYFTFDHIVKIFPIMVALYLMLSVTYYARNYAGIYIIGWSVICIGTYLNYFVINPLLFMDS